MRVQWRSCILFAALLASAGGAAAQQSDEEDLMLSYGDKSSVSIATGSQQPLSRAPAVASVITAQDIQAMGATDLDQALESVPGLHVSRASLGQTPIYEFRGITTTYNPQVLMLVNGIPINEAYLGNRGQATRSMPIDNIERIEVIRGPGSALYGADAFSGVINIITKTASDINGTEFKLRAGSFNTRSASLLHGGKLGPLDVALYVHAGRTDGGNEIVEKDQQSSLDAALGTHASYAPGRLNAAYNSVNVNADISYEKWRLRAGYVKQETAIGSLSDNLDPTGRLPELKTNIDLSYQDENWTPNWNLSAVVGYYDIKEKSGDPAYHIFPAGVTFPWGSFPEGVLGDPSHSERHVHTSATALYTGFEQHRIRLGTGYQVEDMYETAEKKNFTITISPGIGPEIMPLSGMVEADSSLIFMQPHKRHISYVFAQDEWNIAKDWTLTAGVRQDRYSDFGDTTNPRLALVWNAAYNLTVKALHGQAFRAPSFNEEYAVNNPVVTGNPNLKPETISTNELAFSWQPKTDLQTNLSLFDYHMQDIIRFVANTDPTTGSTAQNSGDQKGRGLELETIWDVAHDLRLTGSVSLQHSTDETTGQDAGLAPHKRIFGQVDWRFAPLWQLGTVVNYVADRKREPGDVRPPVPDYTTTDLTLAREKLIGGWDMRLTVSNLFDRDVREPTLAPGNIPFDLPMPGRAFYLRVQHRL